MEPLVRFQIIAKNHNEESSLIVFLCFGHHVKMSSEMIADEWLSDIINFIRAMTIFTAVEPRFRLAAPNAPKNNLRHRRFEMRLQR